MFIPEFKFIRPDVSIFLYYAGKDRHFMTLSRVENKVFLDLPGLLLDDQTFDDDDNIVRALKRADATKRYIGDPLNANRPGATSSFDSNFPMLGDKVDRSFLSDYTNIKIMFNDAKIGDVIIMTPSNHYDPLLIGEVSSRWGNDDYLALPDQRGFTTPFRTVRWLAHDLSRRDFLADVARRLQNRRAITKIDESFYEDIFRYLYRGYIWGNVSKLDIFGPEYNSSDPTSTYEAAFLIKYAVAFYSAYINDKVDEFNALDIEDAADTFFSEEIALQIAQAFGSPGGFVAKTLGPGAGVALAIVLAVTLSSESQTVDISTAQVVQQVQAQPSASHSGLDHVDFGNKLRAGRVDEIRRKYGRKAVAKIGMTLEGERPPEIEVQRARQRQRR